jgi:hypothetical protein
LTSRGSRPKIAAFGKYTRRLLLQIRTRVLNEDWEDTFRDRYSPSPQNSPSSTTLCWRGRAVLTDPDSSGRAPTGAFAGSPLFCWLLRAAVLQPGFQSAAPCGVQACRKLGVVEITAHGLRHSAATILLKHVEKYAIVLRGSLSESRITSEPAILRKIASPSTRGLPRDPQRRQRSQITARETTRP